MASATPVPSVDASNHPSLARARPGRAATAVRFWAVGASGLIVNQVAFVVLLAALGASAYVVAAILATFVSSTWNFVIADRWVFGHRTAEMALGRRFAAFLGLSFALQPIRLGVLVGLVEVASLDPVLANVASLAAVMVARLFVADGWIWREAPLAFATADTGTRARSTTDRLGRYDYDVAGVARISSDVRLPELDWFRGDPANRDRPVDIRIRIGLVGSRPTSRPRFEELPDGRLVYREHLGPLGANFSLRIGDPIEIVVNPLLALSCHVVYTNIVEAFLRFLLVSRGCVLLHAACVAGEAGATLVSAKTDTGKTSTVIGLVRRRGYRFLSDDMTIVTPDGDAIAYPKPMTLSFHTMHVATDGHLTRRDRVALAVQSRLHSKSGREVGRRLGTINLPIMTINALVQALVPPPKYRIEDLFDAKVGGRFPIRAAVLLDRDERGAKQLGLGTIVRELLVNTDDAYGFPPFSTFAPHIAFDGADYDELRHQEWLLLARALRHAVRWRLSDPDRAWVDHLPALIDAPSARTWPSPLVPSPDHHGAPAHERAPVPVMADQPVEVASA
jgi:dolichol-phosphate mannosyltransferase